MASSVCGTPPGQDMKFETAEHKKATEGHEFPADREWLTPLLLVSLFSCFRLSPERPE